MPLTPLHPLDETGVTAHRATTQSKWLTLDNIILHHGRIDLRPGLRSCGPNRTPQFVEGGLPTAIVQLDEPTNTSTTRFEVGETLRPNATTSNVTWDLTGAATVHECIDDDPPDAFTTMVTANSGVGDKFQIGFENTTKTYNAITAVILRFRACNYDVLGAIGWLRIKYAGTTIVEDVPIWACSQSGVEADLLDWQEVTIYVPVSPITGLPWVSGQIDAATWSWEILETPTGYVNTQGYLGVDGDGANTDFGTYSDMLTSGSSLNDDETPIAWFSDATTAIGSTTYGDKQSFTFGDIDDEWASIDSVEVRLAIRAWEYNSDGTEPKHYQHSSRARLFYEAPGGAITYIDSESIVYGSPEIGTQIRSVTLTEDPATGVTWLRAGVNAAKFGIEHFGPESTVVIRRIYIDSAELIVSGAKSQVGTLRIDYVAMDVVGPTQRSAIGIAGLDRLMSTHTNMFRLDSEQAPIEMTDVSDTTTVPTAPATQQWDTAVLYGQAWFTNGEDDLYYYPAAFNDKVFAELTDKPKGKTIASFAGRILLGDTIDAGTRTGQRVTYCKKNDATDWTADTAGFFDLINTPGRVVKLQPINDDTLVAYKTYGIYNVRATGQDDIPFVPDLINSEVGCVSMASLKQAMLPDGQQVHIFLGQHPTYGYSVFIYNGATVANIGEPIREFLRDEMDIQTRQKTFGGVCPRTGTYWLFYAAPDQRGAKQAWVYNIDNGSWTHCEFDKEFTCAGNWKLVPGNEYTASDGDPYMILGGADALPYFLDETFYQDTLHPSTMDSIDNTDLAVFQAAESDGEANFGHAAATQSIPQTIETGDLVLSNETTQAQLNRLWIHYENLGPIELDIYISVDGGINWGDKIEQVIGWPSGKGAITEAHINIPDNRTGHMIRTKIVADNERIPLRISELWLEWEPRGDAI